MNEKVLKIIGLALSVAGAGVTIATSLVADKQLDLKVADEVAKALSKVNEES